MIGLIYLPFLALVHFSSGAVLGGMAALAGKAVCMMRRQDKVEPDPA